MGISMKSTSGKILASVALVGTAAAVAGMGTYGAFSSTTSADQQVTAGSVKITLADEVTSPFSLPIADLLPGDTVEKLVTLSSSTSDLGTVTLTTAGTGSKLTTDTVTGLHLSIEACSSPWTGSPGAYACANARTVLENSAIIGQNVLPADLKSLVAGGTDHLKVTTSLPAAARDELQGLTDTITFTFAATQRDARAK